jgi:hypothetical protein
MNAEEKKGYEAAVEVLKKMIAGEGNKDYPQTGNSQPMKNKNWQPSVPQYNSDGGSSSGGMKNNTDANGNPAGTPELNSADQRKADKAAKQAAKAYKAQQDAQAKLDKYGDNSGDSGWGSKGSQKKYDENGNSQADASARKEAAEACNSVGGMISQETGAKIAKSEGYDDADCKAMNGAAVAQAWKEAAIDSCSKNASGKGQCGNIMSKLKDMYISSHNWKEELRKYVGRAVNPQNKEEKWGHKKWLAMGELKKYERTTYDALDNIIFMIDCSGSVSDKLLQALVGECFNICKKKGIKKVTYCYYDNGISQIESTEKIELDNRICNKIKSNLLPNPEVYGRGANDEQVAMKDLLQILEKKHTTAELVMWFTDGWTRAIPEKPRKVKNMIWVVYDNLDFKASYGSNSRVIHINSEDVLKTL